MWVKEGFPEEATSQLRAKEQEGSSQSLQVGQVLNRQGSCVGESWEKPLTGLKREVKKGTLGYVLWLIKCPRLSGLAGYNHVYNGLTDAFAQISLLASHPAPHTH